MKITVEKEDLVKAQQLYNQDAILNPERFGDIELTEDCAERQINALLEYLAEVNKETIPA